MKNFVLLIVPPCQPPHPPQYSQQPPQFHPCWLLRALECPAFRFPDPPEHQRDRAGININDRLEKGKLEGRFYTLDWMRVSSSPGQAETQISGIIWGLHAYLL